MFTYNKIFKQSKNNVKASGTRINCPLHVDLFFVSIYLITALRSKPEQLFLPSSELSVVVVLVVVVGLVLVGTFI